jgi:hypothetical protein
MAVVSWRGVVPWDSVGGPHPWDVGQAALWVAFTAAAVGSVWAALGEGRRARLAAWGFVAAVLVAVGRHLVGHVAGHTEMEPVAWLATGELTALQRVYAGLGVGLFTAQLFGCVVPAAIAAAALARRERDRWALHLILTLGALLTSTLLWYETPFARGPGIVSRLEDADWLTAQLVLGVWLRAGARGALLVTGATVWGASWGRADPPMGSLRRRGAVAIGLLVGARVVLGFEHEPPLWGGPAWAAELLALAFLTGIAWGPRDRLGAAVSALGVVALLGFVWAAFADAANVFTHLHCFGWYGLEGLLSTAAAGSLWIVGALPEALSRPAGRIGPVAWLLAAWGVVLTGWLVHQGAFDIQMYTSPPMWAAVGVGTWGLWRVLRARWEVAGGR